MADDWTWWAGRSEEYMDLGCYSTREDAIEGGRDSVGEGEGDFVILEAAMVSPPPLDADSIIDRYFEDLGENSDYYSGECDYPEWTLGKGEQKKSLADTLESG